MHTVDVGKSNFSQVVIEGSVEKPVIVDFWAPWCGPCRALTPILEKLAAEYDGRFVLAKLNSDEHPDISARYGVRGIPNVKAFVGGEIVDEFSGALPESAVRQFLDRVLPSPADELRDEAAALYTNTHDVDAALEILERAQALAPANEEVRLDRAALLAEAGRGDEARDLISGLKPLTQMGDRVSALKAKLDLADGAADAGGEDELARRVAAKPDDLDARLQLAHALAARRAYREALEQLIELVQRDRTFRDDAGRKTMLKIFELIPGERDLVGEFRRKLARALN
jgi:putative thioredoxin